VAAWGCARCADSLRLTQLPRHTGQQSVAQAHLSTVAHLEVTVYGVGVYDDLCGRVIPPPMPVNRSLTDWFPLGDPVTTMGVVDTNMVVERDWRRERFRLRDERTGAPAPRPSPLDSHTRRNVAASWVVPHPERSDRICR
jgi:hypothetical protein